MMEEGGGRARGKEGGGEGRSVLGSSFFGIMKCFPARTRPFHFDLNSCYSSSSWQAAESRVSHEVPAVFFHCAAAPVGTQT